MVWADQLWFIHKVQDFSGIRRRENNSEKVTEMAECWRCLLWPEFYPRTYISGGEPAQKSYLSTTHGMAPVPHVHVYTHNNIRFLKITDNIATLMNLKSIWVRKKPQKDTCHDSETERWA